MTMLAENYEHVIGGDPDRDTIDLAVLDTATGATRSRQRRRLPSGRRAAAGIGSDMACAGRDRDEDGEPQGAAELVGDVHQAGDH